MSTPTPSHSGSATVPSPAPKRTAAHNVSTPSNLGHPSPAPRSVPSPATIRKDHAGKTPINHPTTGSSQGSKTVAGGTPMVSNPSQQGSTASPSAANLAAFTPTGLGVDLGTPALGANMVPTMSELGLTASGASSKRNEDDERRAKMRRVLRTVGRAKGRVGEEGIARASRRVGFANDIDAEKLPPDERDRRVGNRTISIAGNTIVIDVDLKDHVPRAVQVLFSSDLAGLAGQPERAGDVLLRDLSPNDACPVNRRLDRFAANLERLARIDRMSSSRLSCFDALSGLYLSLRRLYEQESKLDREIFKAERKAELDVVCKKSGRPAMHEMRQLGFSLAYWMDERHVVRRKRAEDVMEIDEESQQRNEAGDDQQSQNRGDTDNDQKLQRSDIVNGEIKSQRETIDDNESQCHRLHIETERCPSDLYPAIRISDAWLPDPLELQSSSDSPTIVPWQDPPQTFLAPDSDGASALSDDPIAQKLPDYRFVARLDPPLVIPWQTAANIFTSVGATIPQAFHMPIYHTLLLDRPNPVGAAAPSEYITAHRAVLAPGRDGQYVDVAHECRLSVAKNDLGFTLDHIPFSHPRQLLALLPTLRQWACFNALLTRVFAADAGLAMPPPDVNSSSVNGTDAASLDSLLNDYTPDANAALPLELTLTTAPVPTFGLSFPGPGGEACGADVQILPNGDAHVALDGAVGPASPVPAVASSPAARALDACGDLGVWIEWLRARAGAG